MLPHNCLSAATEGPACVIETALKRPLNCLGSPVDLESNLLKSHKNANSKKYYNGRDCNYLTTISTDISATRISDCLLGFARGSFNSPEMVESYRACDRANAIPASHY